MKKLEHDEYLAMRAGAEILEADGFGDKVLRLADGTILKLFRRKRLLSSAAWSPYAQRFADNAEALHRRHIAAPVIIAVWRIPSIGRDGVHYHPLAGKTLREMLREGFDPAIEPGLKGAFTDFVIRLHQAGVYFRSLHLGNVVYTPDQQFGLIDISDARIGRRSLSKQLRARNLRRLQEIEGERDWVDFSAVMNGALQGPPRTL
ncbi:toluene tolerance protein [Candidatus Accumulibacter sp. ACC007]|uniref:toluene tolerance protein n=1 Tax=Candidatus Accumulibacter sp. ACC007 TaxID=2823333 RepID=UPI0025C5A0E2|nr:toluene tolerance protein [Candidatus Accumulibacter sp. ACC007]